MATFIDGKLTLTVATYNIAGGSYCDVALKELAADVIASGADIVGLQEVDRFVPRSGHRDMLAILAGEAGFPYSFFVRAIDLKGGEYGTSILSKYPIEASEVIPLDSPHVEGRSVGRTVINVCGIKVNYFNTHLAFENDEAILYHFDQVAEILKKYDSYIITADYNTNNYALFNRFHGHRLVNNEEHPWTTFPSSGVGIDNIVMTEDWSFGNVQIGPQGHSDHCLLSATLEKQVG